MGDDRPGPDHAFLADLHPRKQHGSRADPAASPQRRPPQLVIRPVATEGVVVCGHDARSDEDFLLDDTARREHDPGLHL